MLLFWRKKVGASWAAVGGNRDAFLSCGEKCITWGMTQWKRTCCSSWILSASRRLDGRSENLHQCSQGQPDDVNVLQHAPEHQSPGSSQRQTRSMTQRYETQDANAEDCHIKNACKKRPYSAETPPEPPSATQDSKIQNTTQRKSQRLAERQHTLAPQANEQPPKPKGKKRQRPSEYKIQNNDTL